MIRVGFSARPLEKNLKNPRPDGLGEYRRTLEIIKACSRWGLRYYNMPPETIGWGDYSKYQPSAQEVEQKFADLLSEIRVLGKVFDIKFSFHARNSAVLTSPDKRIFEKSIREIMALRKVLELVDGLAVYIHPGYTHGNKSEAKNRLIDALNSLPESPVSIGLEVDDVGIGDLDTVLHTCANTRGVDPVIDWGHIWGRGYKLESTDDYLSSVISIAEPYWTNHAYFHFSAVWRRKHIPLDLNLPDYRIFAEAMRIYANSTEKEVIILVESPLRENDAILNQKTILGEA
ncbi:MAG: hypothetical protein K6T91_09750 [Firmicutes bacterium]|nr:hypothetical protein [Bacillota bacterium]